MKGCVDCGKSTPRRRCKQCDRDRRYGADERRPPFEPDAPEAPPDRFLTADGPHRCDICGARVATKVALAKDCSEHGPGGEPA